MNESKRGRPKKVSASGAPEKAKELLIASAKSLFSRYGYEGTTVKDIAEKANANVSLISYHFGGKEGLYHHCVGDHGQERLEMAERILKAPSTETEFQLRLEMFLEEVFRGFIEEPELTIMAFREAEIMSPVVSEDFQTPYIQFFVKIMDFVKSAIDNKVLREDLDPQIAAGIIFSLINHYIRLDAIREKHFSFSIKEKDFRKKLLRQALDILSNGLLNKKAQAFY